MRDFYSNVKTVTAIGPATHSATATGGAIDLKDARKACLAIATGSVNGSGDFSISLQESDTTTPGDFTDAPASLVDTNAPASLEADSDYRLGYRGHKRYVRAILTKAGGTSIQASAVMMLADLAEVPVA